MTYAFGGANHYSGKDMVAAHENIIPHLEESHFNAIVEHFVATLKEMEVPQEDIDAAVAVVATTKDDILAR
jgi:hemoglobin